MLQEEGDPIVHRLRCDQMVILQDQEGLVGNTE
jgi:hypothetical protein